MAGRAARHRGQSGTTLIELLVATLIERASWSSARPSVPPGLAVRNRMVCFVIGARLAGASIAVPMRRPRERFHDIADRRGSTAVVAYQGTCPGASKIRADVSVRQIQGNLQQWTIVVNGAAGGPIGNPVSTFRVNR